MPTNNSFNNPHSTTPPGSNLCSDLECTQCFRYRINSGHNPATCGTCLEVARQNVIINNEYRNLNYTIPDRLNSYEDIFNQGVRQGLVSSKVIQTKPFNDLLGELKQTSAAKKLSGKSKSQ